LNEEIAGHYADVNGLHMYYEEYGSGSPVVLLHGGTSTGRLEWEGYIPCLSEHFKVIVPDCRGHGKTDNPMGKLSYRLMAEDIVALIKELRLEKPFVGGWSDGGQIALEIGIHYSALVKALIVGGALIKISDTYLKELRTWGMQSPGSIDFNKIEQEHPEYVRMWPETHSPVYGLDYWKKLLVDISKMWLDTEEFPGDSISNISVPTLVLHADHDEFIPVEDAVRIFTLIPNAELSIIPNANHFTINTNPKIFAPTIIEFLQRYEK
jgi:pimeloyl-ACP methyl ester carboxylesterase